MGFAEYMTTKAIISLVEQESDIEVIESSTVDTLSAELVEWADAIAPFSGTSKVQVLNHIKKYPNSIAKALLGR